MTNKRPNFATRWMLTRLEIAAIVGILVLTIGGLFVSVQDAVQLEETLNLGLTQTVILSQGIVNLQREVLLTHNEVLRLMNDPDNPLKQVARFDFADIQVNNLVNQVESPLIKNIFTDEDIALVQSMESRSARIKQLIADIEQAETPEQKIIVLDALDAELGTLETTIKQLIDRQATVQREEIIQTRDSLATSQSTSLLAGGTLLLLGISLAVVVRRGLSLRLKQAVESDRLKSQLVANVSHELRTPLNAIRGYSELLDENAYGPISAEQRITIQRILLNTALLQGMVNNLLDRAQIEQGKLSLRNSQFAPADLLEPTLAALNILAKTKDLELKSEIAPDVPALLTGDVLRLQQILFNLTSNALKFTESGSVCARVFCPDAAHWALQVIDTGIGIPIEAQSHIFEPFWQNDSSATRQYRGSGLGLSIVKQLTDLMGGELTMVSQPGAGSTFTIVFPLEVEL
jgi:signal transduction histidine kinase